MVYFRLAARFVLVWLVLGSLQAQTPNAVNGAGGDVFPGVEDCFSITVTNSGAPGYGPYVQLVLPSEITLDSATFLGTPVTVETIGTFPLSPGNQLIDPRSGAVVTGPEGGTLHLLVYPVGSVVTGGPDLVIETCVSIDGATPVGTMLDVDARPVYQFGDTPTGANGPILGTVDTQTYTIVLLTLEKNNDAAESEDPPGTFGVFEDTFTITVDVAPNNSIFDTVINDVLPADLQYVGPVSIVGGINCVAAAEPSTLSPGGTLNITCDEIAGAAGDDLVISYPAFIIDTLDETNCGTKLLQNNVAFDYEFPDNTPLPTLNDDSTITAKHLVLREGAAPATVSPGDTVTFSLSFAVTNYGTATDVVISDIIPDGLTFDAHQSLSIDGGPALAIAPSVVVGAGGETTVTYDVTAVTGDLGPATTGLITFTATVNELYTQTGLPLLAGDDLGSSSTATYDLAAGASGCSDNSSAAVAVAPVVVDKSILNPQSEYEPGDTVIFRISLTIPSGDTSDIVFEDFLPLPVMDATTLDTTFGNDITFAATDTVGAPPDAISVDPATNALRIEWPDLDSTTTETIAVDVAVTIVTEPFADDLFLTNLFRATTANTPGAQALGVSPVAFRVRAPALTMTKGISASDNATADATINPSPAVTPVDGDISSSDAGDTLTYVITVENTGGSNAYDVIVSDPAVTEITSPTIVSVTNGAGSPLAYRDPTDTVPPNAPGLPIPTDLSNGILLDEPIPNGSGRILEATIAASIFTDGGTPGSVDAGDVIEYTVFVRNSGDPVTNAFFTIDVPSNTTFVGSSLSSSQGSEDESGLPTLNVDLGAMGSGGTATITYRVTIDAVGGGTIISTQGFVGSDQTNDEATDSDNVRANGNQILSYTVGSSLGAQAVAPTAVDNLVLVTVQGTLSGTVQPAEVVTNTADVTWAAGVGATAFPAQSDDASATMASPTIDKSVIAISPGYAGNLTQAHIGEVITYQVVVTLPEGSFQNVTLTDLTDNGLALTDVVSITPSSGNVTTDAAGGFAGVLAGAVFSNSGAGSHQLDRQLSLDFSNITNADTNDGVAETLTIVYRAQVINWSSNTRGAARNNRARFNYDVPGSGSTFVQDSAANVTIIESELQVVTTLSPAAGDAADVVTVTMDISHTGSSNADAYDISLENMLPSGMTFNSGFGSAGVAADVGPSHAAGTVSAFWDSIPLGSTAQVSFTVTLDGTVTPTQTIQACTDLEWQSLLAADQGALPSPPNNTLGVERTGDAGDTGGAANTYNDQDCDSLNIADAAIALSIDSVSPGGSSPSAAPGDTVIYRITITLPEGTTNGLTTDLAIPAGFQYQSNSLDTTGFNGSVSIGSASPSGVVGSGQTLAVTFGASTTVVGDNNGGNNSFSVLVTTLVIDDAANDGLPAAQTKTAIATLDYTGNGGTLQDTAAINFVEPDLAITKTMSPDTDIDADTVITITLQVTNNGTGVAHDLVVTDTLNDDGDLFDLTPANVTEITTPAGFTFDYSQPTVSFDGGATTLAAGASITFVFTAVVDADVVTGSAFSNTAQVDGDSQTGSVTGERASTDTGSDSVTTETATAGKTLLTTSESFSTGTDVAIGEVATFRATFDIPEGLTQADGFLVTDTLPAGLQYLSGTASVRAVADGDLNAGTFTVSAWGSSDTVSQDRSLERLDSVCAGDTDSSDAFDPGNAWQSSAADTFTGLGSHSLSCGVPSDIIMSEYIEGTGSNQAIELYNGTGGLIDLNAGAYILEFYFDGSAVANRTINLTGSIADGGTYVIANSAAVAGLTGVADQTEAGSWFDGNDVIILKSGGGGGVILDVFGQIGDISRIPDGPAAIEPNVNGAVLEFDLGDLTNTDNDVDTEQLILEYDVLVLNSADNARTDVKTNTVRLNYLNRDGMGQSLSDTAAVTILEPNLSVNKSAAPATVTGGSAVTFTVVLSNPAATNVTRAWEFTLADSLPAEFQNLALSSATLSRGAVDLSACVTVLGQDIDLDSSCLAAAERYIGPGETVTLVYTADVDPGISFEQQVTNTVDYTATSLPGDNGTDDATPGASGSGTGERTGSGVGENDFNGSDSATVTSGSPTLVKSGDTNLAILDTTTMTVTVDVPVGTTNNFVITDNLPSGLRYNGTLNVNIPVDITTSLTPAAPAAGTDPLVLNFGTITNNAASARQISVTYQVQPENILANQNGTSLQNTATLTYQNVTTPPSDTATITVVEANLEVAKTITAGAAGSDAGDTVSYQVTVTNTGSTATAYRVDFADLLPAHLLGAPDGTGSGTFFTNIAVDNDGGSVVKNAGGALLAGDASFTTTNNADDTLIFPLFDIPPGSVLTITYDAILSNSAVAGETLTSTASVAYNSLAAGGGRDGSDGSDDDTAGVLNNYNESDSVDLTVDSAVAIQKSLNTVHADNDFTIGDLITFDIRVDVIEGIKNAVVLTDNLPSGLDFEGPVRVVAGPQISFSGAGTAVEAPAGTLTIDMGNITNTADGNNSNDFFIVEVDARVLDIVANNDGDTLTNAASLNSDVGPAGPDSQAVDLVEPNLSVTIVADDDTPSLGDLVTYTVTVTHSASNSDAFDVLLINPIPAGTTYVPGSHAGDGSVDESDTDNPEFDLGSITQVEGSKQFTFQVRVDGDTAVGVDITDTINLTYSGQPGTPTVDRAYNGSANETITPGIPAEIDAVKTVAISNDLGSPGVLDPGDTLTYTVTLNNSGAVLTNVVFTDTIPNLTTYVAASLSSSVGGENDAAAPDLVVVVGTMNNGDSVTITFDVTVDAGTAAGTLIRNQGSVDSDQTVPEPTDEDGVDSNGDQPTDIYVGGGPSLSNGLYVEKTVAWVNDLDTSGDVTAGDTMTYTMVIRNRGDQNLTNITISDTLPSGLTYVAASAAITGGGSANVVGSALTADVPGLSVGAHEILTFDVTIDAFVPSSNTYTNQADVDSDQTEPGLSDGNGDPGDGYQPTQFTAVNGIAGTPIIDVEKRRTLGVDQDGDGLFDPGDTIRYTLYLSNSGAAAAENARLSDTIPADTAIIAGSVTSSQGVVVGEDPIDINLGYLAPGALVTIAFEVTIDLGTADGTIIPNQAFLTADGGINEPSDDNGNDGDGKNPTLTPVDTGGGSNAGSPGSLSKVLQASSEAASIGNNVYIGEVLTYRITFAVPAGFLSEVSLTDSLPTGLSYLAGSARLASVYNTGLFASADPGGINGTASGNFVALSDGSELQISGQNLSLFLGDITNSDADVGGETYTLEIQAVVDNSGSVNAGSVLTNSAGLSYLNGLLQLQNLTPVTHNVTVREAVVSVAKSADPAATLTSGGDIQFTVVITNTGGAFDADAYDLNLIDTLPGDWDSMSVDSIVPAGGTSGITDNSAGTVLDIDIAQMPAGGSLTVVYTATAGGPLTPGTLTNTASVTWTSLPGSRGTGSVTPGNSGDADGERNGSGSGANDNSDDDQADVAVGSVSLSKTILNPKTRYAIGDQVEYEVSVSLPNLFAPENFVLSDVLDQGLTYVTGSLMVDQDAGISVGASPADFTRNDDTPIAGQETLTLNLGTVTNSNNAAAGLTFTYLAVVDNLLLNQDNHMLTNTVDLDFNNPAGGAAVNLSDGTSLDVGEPHLTLALTITSSTTGLDAGDTVDFQVVVGNDGTTTAFDVVLDNILPSGLENVTALLVDSATGGAETPGFTNNGNDWLTSGFDLPVGGLVTITFTAELGVGVIPGQTIQNQIDAEFTSINGVDAGERDGSDPGSDQDDDSDLNNYNFSDSAPVITVADNVAIDKTFHPNPAATTYTIGESFVYRITLDLQEGTLDDVIVTDTLPDDLRYESSVVGVGNLGMSTDYAGNPAQAGQVLTFDLGQVVNPGNGNTTDDHITLDITVTVLDEPANVDGLVITNHTSVDFTSASGAETRVFDADGGTPGVQGLDAVIVEPDVTLTKTVNPGSAPLNGEVTFSLLIDHQASSNSDAFDLEIVDTLPSGLTYVAGSANLAPTSVVGQVLTFDIASLTEAADNTTITFRARVDGDQSLGAVLTNNALLTYSSRAGVVADERTYTDNDDASIIVGDGSFIDAHKTVAIAVDGGAAGIAEVGDTLEYTIVLTNSGAAVTNVVFSDLVPTHTTYVAASLTTSKGSVDDSGDPNLVVQVGAMADGDSETITFRVTIDAGTPIGTTIRNQGSVVSDQTVPEPTDEDGIDGNGDQPTDIRVGGEADLEQALFVNKVVFLSDDVDSSGDVTPGDRLTYVLTLFNTGEADLNNVVLNDTVPAGLTYVGSGVAASGAGASATLIGDQLDADIPTIAVNGSETVSFDVFVDGPLFNSDADPNRETFVNQANADSDETEPTLSDADLDPSNGLQPTRISAVDGVVGDPALDVEKRWSLDIDGDGDGRVDPGDTIRYTITIINQGAAPADDAFFADTLDGDLVLVNGSVTTSIGFVVSESPISINLTDLMPGAVAEISMSATIAGGTPAGTIIPNQGVVSGTNFADTNSDDNGNDADGINPTLTPVDGGGTASPTGLDLVLHDTSETHTAGSNLAIGEIATLRLSVNLPAGVLRDAALNLSLPTGLTYQAGSGRLARVFDTGLSAAADPGAVNGAASGTFVALNDGSELFIAGQDLSLSLGDIINSDNDLNNETYILEIQALVDNIAANQAGGTLTVSGDLSYRNALLVSQSLTPDTLGLDLVEPELGVTKSADPGAILTSGGDVVFTVVVTNNGGLDAFDLELTDLLPLNWTALVVDSIVPAGGVSGITDNSAGTNLDIRVDSFPDGGTLTVVYTATSAGGLSEGNLNNTATITWTSLPGLRGTADQTPGNPGDSDGERIGNGGINDYTDADTASVVVGDTALVKTILNPAARYAVGDPVDYQVEISVPPLFVLDNSDFLDVLDDGLDYVPGTLVVDLPVALTASQSAADFSVQNDVPVAGQQSLAYDFGTLTNSSATTQTLTLTYSAVVNNVLAAQNNAVLDNHASLTHDDPGGGAAVVLSDDTALTVGEPHLAVNLAFIGSTVGLDAGDVVTLAVTVSNDGTTTAYENVITHALPTGLENILSLSVHDLSGGAQNPGYTNNGNDWFSGEFDLPVGASVEIRFTAELSNSVLPGQQIQADVQVVYTSRDGIDSGERDGSDPGANQDDDSDLNNYVAQALSPILTVDSALELDKRFHPDPARDGYTIGEEVTYRLTISLIEGSYTDLVLVDSLDTGLTFVDAVVGVGNLGITHAYVGPPVESGNDVSFDFGAVQNPADGDAGNDFITIDLTARVDNIAGNQQGTILANHARIDYEDAGGAQSLDFDADLGTPGIQGLELNVTMPKLILEKTANPTTPAPGALALFTLDISHAVDSDADAYELVIVDTLPAGLTYLHGSASITPVVSGQTLTFSIPSLTLADGNTSITYQAGVDPGVAVGTTLINTAEGVFTTRAGDDPFERTGEDGSGGLNDLVIDPDDAVLTVTAPVLVAQKTDALLDDLNSNGGADPGETIRWSITVTNVGNQTAKNLLFSDLVEDNLSIIPGSVTTDLGLVLEGNNPGDTLIRIDLGAFAATAVANIQFDTRIADPMPSGVNEVVNQGRFTGSGINPVLTDDPDLPGLLDPTIVPIGGVPLLRVQKVDNLQDDLDLSGGPSAGDILRYTLTVTNLGNQAALNVRLTDSLEANLSLVVGSVTTDTGTILSGNGAGDEDIEVDLGDLNGGGTTATITFDIQIADPLPPGTEQVANQALILADNHDDVPSDDPDRPGEDDPTVTGLGGAPILSAQKSAVLAVDADLSGGPSAGDTLTYTVTINNSGNADAENTRFLDYPDPFTALIDGTVTTDLGTVIVGNNGGDQHVDIEIGTLAPGGAPVTITFQVIIDNPLAAGVTQVVNQGVVESDGVPSVPTDDPGLPGDQDPTITPVVAEPILVASKRDSLEIDVNGNGEADGGDRIRYTVTLANIGSQDAEGVTFLDTPDPLTTIVPGSVATTQGVILVGNDGNVPIEVNLGTIAAGADAEITFSVDLDDPLPAGVARVLNQGTFIADNHVPTRTDDPDIAGEDDPTITPLAGYPLLRATKRDFLFQDLDNNGVASAGDTLLYQIRLSNIGNRALEDVLFTDVPDPIMTVVPGSLVSSRGTVLAGGDGSTPLLVDIGRIAAGEVVDLSFRVQVPTPLPAGKTQTANQAVITSNELPAVPTDDPDTLDEDDPTITPLVGDPELEAVKTVALWTDADSDGIASAGDTLRYDVVIINHGDADGVNLVFTDTPDRNTTIVPGSITTDHGTVVGGNAGVAPIIVNIGDLPASGGAVSISFLVNINNPLPGFVPRVVNQGLVTLDNGPGTLTDDPSLPGDDDPTVTPLAPAPEIQARKTDYLVVDQNNNSLADAGDEILYLVTIRNTGGAAETNLIFTDFPDLNTQLVPGTIKTDQGDVLAGNDGQPPVRVRIPTLEAGDDAQISFRVRLNDELPVDLTQIANQGFVVGDRYPGVLTDDPDIGGGEDPTITPVGSNGKLHVAKTDFLAQDNDLNGFPSAGDELGYLITITNTGNIALSDVTFTDTPDVATSLVAGSVTTSRGTILSGNLVPIQIEIGAMQPGEIVTIAFNVSVADPLPPGLEFVSNQAVVSSNELDDVPSDDPDLPGDDDPTDTPVADFARLVAFKVDTLVDDINGDRVPSPGDTVLYQIRLANIGNQTVTGIQMTDTPDINTTIVAGSLRTSQGNILAGNNGVPPIQIDIGQMASGEQVLISFEVLIVDPLPIDIFSIENQAVFSSVELPDVLSDDPDGSGDEDVTPTLVFQTDMEITIDAAPDPIHSGETLTFTIRLENLGPQNANPVVMTDHLPNNVDFISATVVGGTPDQCNYDAVNHTLTCELGFMPIGDVQTILLDVVPLSEGPVVNEVEVDAIQIDPESANNIAQIPVNVLATIDLELQKTLLTAQPAYNQPAAFQLDLINNGPDTATGIVVRDLLPAGLDFISAGASQGSYDSGTGLWSVGTLNNGASAQLTLNVVVSGFGTITNTAEVTAADQLDSDSVPDNGAGEDDYDSADIVINALSDLMVTKRVVDAAVAPGDQTLFVIEVTNLGPTPATGVAMEDVLPAGLTPISASPSVGSFDPGTLVWTIGPMAADQVETLEFLVQVDDDLEPGQIVNVARVSANEPDPNPDNNEDTETLYIAEAIPTLGAWALFFFVGFLAMVAMAVNRRRV